jgi:glycosyltransferase involved in cell wall biosynthesis
MRPGISIVIRALNERARLAALLDALKAQDYKGEKQIVVVDNASTDGTPELARDRGVRVVTISRGDFSFPASTNRGVRAATQDLVALTVGHALPVRRDWLSSGARHFRDPHVAGVFSPVLARSDSTWAEYFFYLPGYLKARIKGVHDATPTMWPGIMGATNCMLRRSLWETHLFDERYGKGGDDVEWAHWAIREGYRILCDYTFAVYHSHGNDRKNLELQIAYWKSLGVPHPFRKEDLAFRKDIRWDPLPESEEMGKDRSEHRWKSAGPACVEPSSRAQPATSSGEAAEGLRRDGPA